MTGLLSGTISVGALLGALWCLVMLMLSGPKGHRLLLGWLALVEVALVVQAVVGISKIFGEHRHIASATFVGYLLGALLILPAAGWWSLAERSRWGVGVLMVGCLVIPVLVVRMNQIWSGYGA
ncbi:hypothetical protein [Rhodococcus sp. X156]|uniref:hypothetical protein n=1 Tax=Rhodococcus sp. X156 TaxID=2499145 RepID=UPI0019D26399|nr:hypothetical protein [Rhodococcus sp. X156]